MKGVIIFVLALWLGTSIAENLPEYELQAFNASSFSLKTLCSYHPHGTKLPNSYDCSTFFVCDYDRIHMFRCSSGLLYDEKLGVCNWAVSVHCNSASVVPVEPPSPPCGCACGCPAGELDPAPEQIACYDEGFYFVPHPNNCEYYYICAKGTSQMHHCAPGVHWDYIHHQCDYPQRAICFGKNSTNSGTDNNQPTVPPLPEINTDTTVETTEETTTSPPIVDTPLPLPDCSNGAQFYAYPFDDTKYYICIGGLPMVMNCPPTYHWNAQVSRCEQETEPSINLPQPTPETERPACDGEEDFFAYPYDCTRYYICIGSSAVIMKCPENYEWNEYMQRCEAPQFAKCTPKYRN